MLNQQVNSQVAFIKMIFNLIDKQKVGHIVKIECLNNLHFDDDILTELGFTSNGQFVNILSSFETEKEGVMTEKEFITFLLSQQPNQDQNLDQNDYEVQTESNDMMNQKDYVTDKEGGYDLDENSKEIKSYNKNLTKDIKTTKSGKKGKNAKLNNFRQPY